MLRKILTRPWGLLAALALALSLAAAARAADHFNGIRLRRMPPEGDNRFWIWDLTVMPPGFRQPTFTEAANVEHLHVWVEDGLGTQAPSPAALQALVPAFLRDLAVERPLFGNQPTPPSQDSDIHLLIAAIPPYDNHGKKVGFDGFFNVYDQLTEAAAQAEGQHSNQRDILYINALQDVTSDYMLGVVAHELNHLLTFGRGDTAAQLDPWVNEMLGEAAMQLTGYFTDARHVAAYRANTAQPLAVMQFGISYGGLSLLAEYLLKSERADLLGRLPATRGDGFERIAAVYGRAWTALFADYVRWLFEEESAFPGAKIQPIAAAHPLRVAPTGVLYLDHDPGALKITAAPAGCAASTNAVRTAAVRRADASATAVWIESTPPCAVSRGGAKFEPFTLENGRSGAVMAERRLSQ